jgi:hypothetical protein
VRRRTRTSYQRAGSSPGSRQSGSQSLTGRDFQSHLSPLARYIAENEDSGIPIPELVEQFQELDCEHPADRQRVSANSPTAKFITCDMCGKTTKVMKK